MELSRRALLLLAAVALTPTGCDQLIGDGPADEQPADEQPPGEVSDLQYRVRTGEILLQWRNPSDEDFDHTEVWYGREGEELAEFDGEVSRAGTLLSGLTRDTAYEVRILTVDEAGNESAGTVLELATKQYAASDFVAMATGSAIRYHVDDSHASQPVDTDAWEVFQPIPDPELASSMADHAEALSTLAPGSDVTGFMSAFLWDGHRFTQDEQTGRRREFLMRYAGIPSFNAGSFLMSCVIIPSYFSDGESWTIGDREFAIVATGVEHTVDSTTYEDCVRVTVDRPEAENQYTAGAGSFVLAEGVGLIELEFERTDTTTLRFAIENHMVFGDPYTISGEVIEGGSTPAVGLHVQPATLDLGLADVTDDTGAFSVSLYGSEIGLYVGYDDDNDHALDYDDFPTFPKRVVFNNVTTNLGGLSIELEP